MRVKALTKEVGVTLEANTRMCYAALQLYH